MFVEEEAMCEVEGIIYIYIYIYIYIDILFILNDVSEGSACLLLGVARCR